VARNRPIAVGAYVLCALSRAIAPDVGYGHSFAVQNARDEKESVAFGGVLLAAHHGNTEPSRPNAQPTQAVLELRRFGDPSIQHVAIRVIELVAVGTSTKLCAKKHVLDAGVVQSKLKIPAVELWVEP
jgi:hypothetical protein